MPRQAKGPRLHRHVNGVWAIRDDGGVFKSTGTRNRREAEGALATYIATKHRPTGPATPDQVTVSDALRRYGEERGPLVKDAARIGDCITALVAVLGDLPVASVTGEVCRRYAKARNRAPGTVRKELSTLQAAINHCVREGYLTTGRQLTLPKAPPPRDRWLTRNEVAALLRAARRDPNTRHLCRYILLGVYSGTRSTALLNLRFMPHVQGGWIDTEKGIIYRRAAGQAETKKRTPPAPIPRRLLAHLRRWERMGAVWAVEYKGARIASVKTVWRHVLKRAEIPHCTRHDLRHTCATWLMQSGADTWSVAGYLGMTVQMLERVYGHHHPDFMRNAVDALDRRRIRSPDQIRAV